METHLLEPPTDLKKNDYGCLRHAGSAGVLSFECVHFIYKTTNSLTGEYYIGLHSTKNPNDGYLGSGVRLRHSVRKYGRQAFTREIIEYLPSREALAQRESQLVTESILQDPLCLNLTPGGDAPSPTAETRQRMSLAHRGQTPKNLKIALEAAHRANLGAKRTEDTRAKMRAAKQRRSTEQCDELRRKISEAMRLAWRRRKAEATHVSG